MVILKIRLMMPLVHSVNISVLLVLLQLLIVVPVGEVIEEVPPLVPVPLATTMTG